jgi:hypothetical protein
MYGFSYPAPKTFLPLEVMRCKFQGKEIVIEQAATNRLDIRENQLAPTT